MKTLLLTFALLFCSLWGNNINAAPFKTAQKKPILLKSDNLDYDEELGLTTATGHVILSDGSQLVEADRVVYNQKLNMITATGNVYVYDEQGNVLKTHYVELTGDFKELFMQESSLLTRDKERLAATRAQKTEAKTSYEKAVYSPCALCATNPLKSPTWQIKADTVTYDEESDSVSYRDATMEIKGVPVFYTPYFSHPGPKAKRKSGFLAPFLASESNLGPMIGTPYYLTMGPSKDVTLTPIIATRQNPILLSEYRQRFKNANLLLKGSFTRTNKLRGPKKKHVATHGHFLGKTQVDLNDHWHFDGQFFQASNPSYIKRYSFVESLRYRRANYLESFAHTEGFYDANYVGIHAYRFQNLRPDIESKTVPDILPATEFSYFSPKIYGDSYMHLKGNTLSIRRNQGNHVNRLSTTAEWILPYTSKGGSLYKVKTFVRGDYYDIRKYTPLRGDHPEVNTGRGRVIPGGVLSWQKPFVGFVNKTRWIIEPLAVAVIKPLGYNSYKIPNEDSKDFEFDPRNLFSENRFIGEDLVDEGQHISYGLNINAYQVYGVDVRAFLGQSYDFSKTRMFSEESGVRQGSSDYLGRLKLTPGSLGFVDWRFRLDNRTGKIKKNLVSLAAGPEVLRLHIDYLYLDRVYLKENDYAKREQLFLKLSSKISEEWDVFVGTRREFKHNSGPLEESLGATYHDDCFSVTLEGIKTHYHDRDMVPATTVMLTLGFKNLGDLTPGRIHTN